MKLKFTETHNAASAFLEITENGEIIAQSYLMISSPHAEKLCGSECQITKKPEPVYYLDLKVPEKMDNDAEIFAAIFKHNGKEVIVTDKGVERYGVTVPGDGRYYLVRHDWLKQKPAQPTVEELQERLSNLTMYIGKFPPDDFNRGIFMRILSIAAGEE